MREKQDSVKTDYQNQLSPGGLTPAFPCKSSCYNKLLSFRSEFKFIVAGSSCKERDVYVCSGLEVQDLTNAFREKAEMEGTGIHLVGAGILRHHCLFEGEALRRQLFIVTEHSR